MNPVNNVDSNSDINTLNPAQMSQQDFISAIYLERSEMLDSEVRRIIGDIDKSNQYIDIVQQDDRQSQYFRIWLQLLRQS